MSDAPGLLCFALFPVRVVSGEYAFLRFVEFVPEHGTFRNPIHPWW